jgi:glycosyltransferase involved in cell wall biosynthesis
MKIAYLGYWPASEVLTQAVILPRLKILSELPAVSSVVFFSIERAPAPVTPVHIPNVTHIPLHSKPGKNLLLTKLSDFVDLPVQISGYLKESGIDLLICNSPLAGAIGYLVHRRITVPFMVECYEPHADYMLESGVWKFWDVRFLILKFFEKKQKRFADKLLTVSHHYSEKLRREGVPKEKIKLLPNTVALNDFAFDQDQRRAKRNELSIASTDVVGIYAGKFKDIYYYSEAFDLFAEAFRFFGSSFYLIILSSYDQDDIRKNLTKRGVPADRFFVGQVPHGNVPAYLSSADFAFSTIKPAPCRLYCCPVKDGEYWANGLPVLLEPGIGDDSDIIQKEGGGVQLDMTHPVEAFTKLREFLKQGREGTAIPIQALAYKYRRMDLIKEVYTGIIRHRPE